DVRTRIGSTNNPGILIDNFPGLVRIDEKVANLAHTVPIFDVEWCAGDDAVTQIVATRAVHVVRPRQIKIPGVNGPLPGFRIKEIEIVFPKAYIVMVDRLDDGMVPVDFVKIGVFSPPFYSGRGVAI